MGQMEPSVMTWHAADIDVSPAAPQATSTPLDIEGLIGPTPVALQAAQTARAIAYVGELVRRSRTARGLSQAALAQRTGMTQAHISELERGLGSHGPTVATLNRIMQALGDEMLFDTASNRAPPRPEPEPFVLT